MVRILRQEGEQVELLRRELRLFPVDPHAPRGLVDLDAADFDDVVLVDICADEAIISGQMRLHPRHQLTRRERLRDVIVCAQSQTANLVDVILLGRDHQDGGVEPLADLAADVEAVHSRQHQVEDEEIVVAVEGLVEAFVTVGFDVNFEA